MMITLEKLKEINVEIFTCAFWKDKIKRKSKVTLFVLKKETKISWNLPTLSLIII